jgi:hypothetical protein
VNKNLVKEIFLQAGGPHLYAANKTHNDILVRLIVEECVNVLEHRAEKWRDDDAALESRRSAQAIKDHFGLTNDQ